MLKKRNLGNTGFRISEISLGTWSLGGLAYGTVSADEARACLKTFIEHGGNFIDTAHLYDEAERRIGDFLRQSGKRSELIIASKSAEKEASRVRQDLDQTLRLLGCDYVDLYYLHAPPDDPDEMKRSLDVYEALKYEGKIKAIGASVAPH